MTPQEHVIDVLREAFGTDRVKLIAIDKAHVVVRSNGKPVNVAVTLTQLGAKHDD